MGFGQSMDVDDPKVDLIGQGHRWKVKVTRSKRPFQVSFDSLTGDVVKGH